jgi:hypothetical protein
MLPRAHVDQLGDWISGNRPTSISLPTSAIARWKDQFNDPNPAIGEMEYRRS